MINISVDLFHDLKTQTSRLTLLWESVSTHLFALAHPA